MGDIHGNSQEMSKKVVGDMRAGAAAGGDFRRVADNAAFQPERGEGFQRQREIRNGA